MNFPESFVERSKSLLGDEYNVFEAALQTTPPVSVRVNNKIDMHPSEELVPWCEKAYYLQERPLFTADPLLHAGAFYVQEASSMFLYQAVKQHFPSAKRTLDLCAAPGGKSTLLLQSLPDDGLLVSNEIIRSRAHILAENITKWGNPNAVVTNNSPADFGKLPGYFDAVVVDAPCSGEGMFRKDADAAGEWSLQLVNLCAERQREIVSSVWKALKPDGILVYSTCTFNREENE
ncbi:MAG: RsmB/NOP family class I SAM-dependent RNA methyltransferase, partial [Prevotellaceae bacterium]|nr:RsmB/NOP family class I SAM-dependent RNA methyltransferase [Prevotellaceae bacterium]